MEILSDPEFNNTGTVQDTGSDIDITIDISQTMSSDLGSQSTFELSDGQFMPDQIPLMLKKCAHPDCASLQLEHNPYCNIHYLQDLAQKELGDAKYAVNLSRMFHFQEQKCWFTGLPMELGLNEHIWRINRDIPVGDFNNIKFVHRDIEPVLRLMGFQDFVGMCQLVAKNTAGKVYYDRTKDGGEFLEMFPELNKYEMPYLIKDIKKYVISRHRLLAAMRKVKSSMNRGPFKGAIDFWFNKLMWHLGLYNMIVSNELESEEQIQRKYKVVDNSKKQEARLS